VPSKKLLAIKGFSDAKVDKIIEVAKKWVRAPRDRRRRRSRR
jgi:hypothetical protein